ncbi:calcium-binding protein [Bradyrhizobium sp. CCGUVB14]|uniref:beta strand repeat-containing protein n=1 Tax=Bradyrhizobium sp. CCGUVB14 TaxID=2949628 RepID=UPI0020B35669|nr:calcium-binding protein [Bradyrhizobium sp. CCGUVB14]MCP3447326.1 hypothetical protein [Bradyrhizobium sp. CCGUVB14]
MSFTPASTHDYIAHFEGGTLNPTTPFYYEPASGDVPATINFGYGLNLTSAEKAAIDGDTTLKDSINDWFSAHGITVTETQWESFATVNSSNGTTIESSLNSGLPLDGLGNPQDWTSTANDMLDSFVDTYVVPTLLIKVPNLSELPSSTQGALIDMYYHSPSLLGDGTYGAARSSDLVGIANELAYATQKTPDSTHPGLEQRYLGDALLALGIVPTFDGNNKIVSLDASGADVDDVEQFLSGTLDPTNMLGSGNISAQDYISLWGSSSVSQSYDNIVSQCEQYLISKGSYVVQSGDTPISIAAAVNSQNGLSSSISALDLEAANGFFTKNGFSEGDTIFVPVGTSGTNYIFQFPNSHQAVFDPVSSLWSLYGTSGDLPNGGIPSINSYLMNASDWFSRVHTDPLVLDLSTGATGVELTSLAASSAYFDLDNSGFAVHTGWVGPTTGLLVRDNNNNGIVDNITELFGNSSIDGFTALKALDSNNDNKITSADSGWSSLKVWVDANGDGVTDSGELQSLSALDITEIALNTSETSQEVNGNLIGAVATFKRSDDSTGQVAEAFFDNNQMDSTFAGSYDLDPEVLLLPNLRGYGTVPDLYIAMSMDSTLKGMVSDLVSADPTDVGNFDAEVTQIIYRWTGVDGLDPVASRGGYVNGQDLGALEAFMGQQYRILDRTGLVTGWDPTNPANAHQGTNLEAAWSIVFNMMKAQLLVQGPLASLFDGVSFDYNSGGLTATDLSTAATNLVSSLPEDSAAAIKLLAYYTPLLNDVAEAAGVAKSGYDTILQDAFGDFGFSFSTTTIDNFSSSNASNAPLQSLQVTGSSDHILYTLSGNGGTYTQPGYGETLTDNSTGNDLLVAGDGKQAGLYASSGNNVLIAGNGFNDSLFAGSGNDLLISGDGDENYFYAGTGTTTIVAGNGNNTFYGNTGTMILTAGSGDDIIQLNHTLGAGSSISGGDGTDTLLLEQSVQGQVDISNTDISGIENIKVVHAVMTADQLDDVASVGGLISTARIDTASSGTYSLAGKGDDRIDLFAYNDDVTLVGNDADNEQIYANWASNVTLTAGGGNNVVISAGSGSGNTYIGGSGTTTISFDNALTMTGTIVGGTGTTTLFDYNNYYPVDITGASISGVSGLIVNQAKLTAGQFNGFDSIAANLLIAKTSGTYDLSGKSTGRIDLTADTNSGVTFIGNDANGEILTASSSGNDTLIGGDGNGVSLYGGGGTNTLTAGDGDYASLYAGSGTSTLNGGNGAHNTIHTSSGTVTVNAGDADTNVIVTNGLGSGSSITGGSGDNTLTLVNDADMQSVGITGIQHLVVNSGAFTEAQFDAFDTIAAVGSFGHLNIGTAGTYSLVGKGSARIDMAAFHDNINLIGNDADNEILAANGSSNCTFTAGGGNNVFIYGGSGTGNTYTGGSGTTTISFETASTITGTIVGGSGTTTLYDYTYYYNVDMTGATITGVDNLVIFRAKLTADQFNGFSSIQADTLYLETAGTYSMAGKGTARADLKADTNAGVTLIGNDANGEILTASASGTDTLTAGDGNGATLYAGGGTNTLNGGNGTTNTMFLSTGKVTVNAGDANTAIVVSNTLGSGSSITGGSGDNTLILINDTDMQSVGITGIQHLLVNAGAFTEAQFDAFDTIEALNSSSHLNLGTTGTYSLAGKGTSRIDMNAFVGGITLIGNNADGESLSAFFSSGSDVLTAGNGNNVYLYGSAYDDTLTAGTGTGTLQGDGGNDTYKFGSGFTQDTVINNGGGSANGEIDFTALASTDLWFKQVGNDLEIDSIGTSNKVTVAGWYNSASAKVASVHTDDGLVLDSQLASLVSAMATYSANNSGFDPATATAMPTDTTLQSALASSWHS